MPDIVQEVTIEAMSEKVFNAITRQDELAQWWTNHVTAEPRVGSLAEFSFDNEATVFKMEITKLDAEKSVHHNRGDCRDRRILAQPESARLPVAPPVGARALSSAR